MKHSYLIAVFDFLSAHGKDRSTGDFNSQCISLRCSLFWDFFCIKLMTYTVTCKHCLEF